MVRILNLHLSCELNQGFRQIAFPNKVHFLAGLRIQASSSYLRVSRSDLPDDAVLPDEIPGSISSIPEDISRPSVQLDPEEDEDETR